MTRRRPLGALGAALCLAALTAAVYRPVGAFPFIGLDDPWYVYHNPRVEQGLSWQGAVWAATTFTQANWHPLTWLSHLADVTLFGLDAGRHHLVSLGLHAASAALLFLVLRAMTGAAGPSWLAAALFAVHPLHVESVAWVSERKDVLSGLLFVLALCAHLGWARRGGRARYLLLLATFALGLTAKPMLVTLPLVLLLLDWWPLGRLVRDGRLQRGPLAEKAPLLALSAASSVVTFVAQRSGGAVNMMEGRFAGERAANALHAYAAYLADTVWPSRLSVFHPFPDVRELAPQIVAASALLLALSCAAYLLRRRMPFLAAGWCWYLGMLFPVIGLVKVGLQGRADRYTYLPLIGVFVALAWSGWRALAGRPRGPALFAAGTLALLAPLSLAARGQVDRWRDDETLFSHSLAVNPDDWIAHYILGDALVKKGRVGEAQAHFREAVRLNPRYAEAQNNLALTLAMTGSFEEAGAHHREAVTLDPARPGFAFNYAGYLAAAGRTSEAEAWYRRALQLDPSYAEAHNNLGLILCNSGRAAEALAHFDAAVRSKPDFTRARVNREACAAASRAGR